MSNIKQILFLKKQGVSNREAAKMEGIDKETVNIYVRFINDNRLAIDELLKKDEPELEQLFHAGNPAYTDGRMRDFLEELPYYREQLRQQHVTRYLLWTEYRARHHNGYGKSQFFFHLRQNLVAVKDRSNAVMAKTYVPGQKLYVDFAGDELSYVDLDTGEEVQVEVFVACMPYSDYAFVTCVPSQKKEDFTDAIRQCIEGHGQPLPFRCDALPAIRTDAEGVGREPHQTGLPPYLRQAQEPYVPLAQGTQRSHTQAS